MKEEEVLQGIIYPPTSRFNTPTNVSDFLVVFCEEVFRVDRGCYAYLYFIIYAEYVTSQKRWQRQ